MCVLPLGPPSLVDACLEALAAQPAGPSPAAMAAAGLPPRLRDHLAPAALV